MARLDIKEVLSEAYLKVRPERTEIETFKKNLIQLIDGIKSKPTETEEFVKNLISDFLKNTWYSPDYFINTSRNIDLVIHNGDNSMPIGVMIETKSPRNKNEMVSNENLNAKAMQELLLYYLQETKEHNNISVKNLIISNGFEWFIFDAHEFYEHFTLDKKLLSIFNEFTEKSLLANDTNTFYTNIAFNKINEIKDEIDFVSFNILDFEKIIRNNNTEEDIKLLNLFKVLSPNNLLKKSISNDSNTLNENFYQELLYIIGLSEKKEDGKMVIARNDTDKRQNYSLLENAMFQLCNEYAYEEIIYEMSLELNITWINRILFLKLLEAQLIKYQNNTSFSFLNSNVIKTFNELNSLFFNVLAVEPEKRSDIVKDKYKNVPYLNSSLFEKTENESKLMISGLANEDIDIFHSTVLLDVNGNRRKGKIKILDYIFEFLNAFDFSSDVSEKIQEKHKTLINASVLGLIFEKINGYKEGSFFTPGFVTSYICSETLKKVVIEKFNTTKGWKTKSLKDIYNKLNSEDFEEANKIVNSIRILDPAVGSGHFLVSALNELILIKNKLGILVDSKGQRIRIDVEILNDDLIIYDEFGKYFEYDFNSKENQRIQETIFKEKRILIENCLFGVDINPNSVKICRLRLWIELLKHSYYTKESKFTELETLPNIDINIKNGNSLISRFSLTEEYIFTALKYSIKDYKEAVQKYKESKKAESKKLLDLIKNIKNDFSNNFKKQNKLYKEKSNLENKLALLGSENIEFGFISDKQLEDKNKKAEKIKQDIINKQIEIEAFNDGRMYANAFEWRFEFPEVLDIDGKFIGFDAIIGNPPYLREGKISKSLFEDLKNSPYYQGKMDIWYLFACNGFNLLKENGILTFIATNNWTTAAGAGKLRNAIIDNTRINKMIDFTSFMVFENASIQTMIMSFTKDKDTDDYSIDYRRLIGEVALSDALALLNKKINSKAEYLSPVIKRENFRDKYLTFNANENIFDKISEKGILLTEKEIANGIHPHYDFVNNKLAEMHNLKKGEGIFCLSKKEKDNLNLTKDEQKIIKPFYTTDEISRYFTSSKYSYYIIYTTSKYKDPHSMDNFPNLKKHLDRFKNVITSANKPYGLHRSREERFFKGEKIMAYRKCVGKPIFSYSDFSCYVSAAFYIIKTNRFNNKYLLGLLNSKLIAFWLKNKGKMQGNNYQLDKEPLLQIPIFNPSATQQTQIITLVDKILEAKKEDVKADTSKHEKKIDELVYKLYDLTDTEIELIENTIKL